MEGDNNFNQEYEVHLRLERLEIKKNEIMILRRMVIAFGVASVSLVFFIETTGILEIIFVALSLLALIFSGMYVAAYVSNKRELENMKIRMDRIVQNQNLKKPKD